MFVASRECVGSIYIDYDIYSIIAHLIVAFHDLIHQCDILHYVLKFLYLTFKQAFSKTFV